MQDINYSAPSEIDDSNICDSSATDNAVDLKVETNQIDDGFEKNRMSDPGLWKTLSEEDIQFWLKQGPHDCQNHAGPFENSTRTFSNITRRCTPSVFKKTLPNGDPVTREHILYSVTLGAIFCFVCKLFGTNQDSSLENEGFCDWKNHSARIDQHENSKSHKTCLLTYITRKTEVSLPDSLCVQIENEMQYWRNVLKRVISTTRLLAERGLSFRGSDEKFGSCKNGNFLGVIELLAEYDPFLAAHIAKHGNTGKGNTSYLSKTIYEELIEQVAVKVRNTIINEVKAAGYYSISVDSTPDCAHIDQLSIVLRYVSPSDFLPVERFIGFINPLSHKGEELANILQFLVNKCGLSILRCRGQSYDNAANMSGKYNGMQKKILEHCKYATYIPCTAHSLNLVGRSAVDSCVFAVNFFSNVQAVYRFFVSSTHRWNVLKQNTKDKNVVKSLSETRWEAHAAATSALYDSYEEILNALFEIADDNSQKGDTIKEANNIAEKMQELEFAFMLCFWCEILIKFRNTSQTLQSKTLNLSTCSNLYLSLSTFISSYRDKFEEMETKAQKLQPDCDYKAVSTRKIKRKKQINDGSAEEVRLSPRDNFRINTFNVIIDKLYCSLNERGKIYANVASKFEFMTDRTLSEQDCNTSCDNLINNYPDDLNTEFSSELQQFQSYLNNKLSADIFVNHSDMYEIIIKDNIKSVFPNVEIALRIFLTLVITNCSTERSFSQLKFIKNPKRSTMNQDRLDSLALLCIESDILRRLNFEDIIEDFSRQKSRQKLF